MKIELQDFWRLVRAELACDEVAEAFDGEDPLKLRVRAMLDDARDTLLQGP